MCLGEWTLVLVLACKQLGIKIPESQSIENDVPGLMESIGLKDVHWYVLINIVSSTSIYFTLGGFLQWYFYIRQRNQPEEWKCQPKRYVKNDVKTIPVGTTQKV
jgi:lathosterol oxidase